MILIAALTATFFFGGWRRHRRLPGARRHVPRGARPALAGAQDRLFPVLLPVVPRDVPALPLRQIMRLGWKVFIPVTLVWLCVEAVMWIYKIGPWPPEEAMRSILKTFFLYELLIGLSITLRTSSRARSRSSTRKRRPRSRRASAACTRCAATRTARSAASPASSARRCAPRSRSRSSPTSAPTARAARRATTSTSSSASTAASARRPARSTRSSRPHPRVPHGEPRREHHDQDKLLAVGERYEAMIAADKAADAPYR